MINSRPIFQYHISGLPEVLTEESPLWQIPLMGRDAGGILIHEYFDLAKKFIQSDNYSALQDGVEFILNMRLPVESFDQIDIYLEKHGAFYHPARVEVSTKERVPLLFVLNTAVSNHGLALIKSEYLLLKHLSALDLNNSLPKVFSAKTMECRDLKIAFFLATWFDGYREFHLTDATDMGDKRNLHLWNSDGSTATVLYPLYFEIYEKATEILTFFYNIKSSEQICGWHHAAGDFIVKQIKEGFDVKLITVRDYRPIVESDSQEIGDAEDSNKGKKHNNENFYNIENIEDTYKTLLIFFLNLTLRMRIDRVDGIGDRSLVDGRVIPFILKGFFRALEKKQRIADEKIADNLETSLINIPKVSLVDGFKSYLMQFSHENLYEILLVMIDEYHPDNPETSFVRKILKSHSEILFYYICNGIETNS